MSKILEAMRKVTPEEVDLGVRLASIDRGNLYPLPDAQTTAEFEQLANSLLRMAGGGAGQSVVFASTTSGEGASYVSYNCARMMASLLDRPIAWVDANFESPTAKVSAHELNLRDLLVNPDDLPATKGGSGLVLVGNGRQQLKHLEHLNSGNYSRLVRKFEENFFFTCIDAPPILAGVEVAHLAQPTMGLVLVVESRRCKHEVIRHGLERLRAQGVNVLGTVLNKRIYELPGFVYRRF